MSDEEFIPPSPTFLNSTQERYRRISSTRSKLRRFKQKHGLQNESRDDPAEIALSCPGPNAANSIFNDVSSDEEEVDQDVEEAHAYSSCSSFVTPVSKRAKWAQETTDQNPRKLNYDSDDLTQRHSPDSSTPGSPVFFDLDDDDEQEVVVEKEAKSVTPRPTEETEKFDLSAGSPLIKSLRQLGSQMGQSQVTKDSQAERSHSPDDHYETSRDPSFVFGGPIPEGAELGFRTAANLPVHIPPNANYVDLFGDSQDTDDDELMKSISPPKSHLDPFQDSQMNDDLLQSVANLSSQRRIKEQAAPKFNGFVSAAGNIMFVPSEEDLERARRWEEELELDMAKTIALHSERPSPVDHETCAELEKVYELEQQRRCSQKSVSFASPQATGFKPQMSTPRPRSSQFSMTQEVSAAVHAVIQDSEFFLSQLPVSPIGREAVLERKMKRQALVCNPRRNMLLSRVSQQKPLDLIQALKESGGEGKLDELKKPFKSEFLQKKLGSKKVSLRDAFGSFVGQGNGWDLKPLPAFSELLKFKFDALEFLSNDEIVDYFSRGIPAAHFQVPMTPDFLVGADELELAFLAAPGIDPQLVGKGWFANALKFVLWKVISMDLHLPAESHGEILTLGNVLNELHYRYYEEIDRSRRSILRECLEMDEAPGQLMVLVVADVGGRREGAQVELSDGHYSVRAEVDEFLERQVERGKLRRGTKVMVDSAEFVNLHEGCAPLEVPASVALRIHGNSTRRCRWDTRLGRYYARRRLQVSLAGVDAKGGTISAMDVLVIRKYPLLFVAESRHRNERMHCRYRKELESRHYNLFERLYHKVDKELTEEEEEAERDRWRQIPEYETVDEVKDLEELWHILNSGRSAKLSEDQLGEEQKQKLDEFREEKNRRRREKIKARVEEIMEKGLSSPSALLRIKVADLKSPSLDRCAELWIWNVDDEVGRLIKEGGAIHVENVLTMGMRNNVLNLKGGRKFLLREAEKSATDETVLPLPGIRRRLTRLAQITDPAQFSPTFLEFDVVVIILKVVVRKEKFQNVFATDDHGNVICLNFFMGLREYACEDLVVPGRVIAFSNVQWRRMNMFGVPNGYIHELTVMTTNPRQEDAIHEMDRLKRYLEDHTLDAVLEGVTRTHSFLRPLQSGVKTSPGHSSFLSPVRIPKTPERGSASASASFVTPGRGAFQTPLIERQINLLSGNNGSCSPGDVPSVFRSPKTPARIGAWKNRKSSIRK